MVEDVKNENEGLLVAKQATNIERDGTRDKENEKEKERNMINYSSRFSLLINNLQNPNNDIQMKIAAAQQLLVLLQQEEVRIISSLQNQQQKGSISSKNKLKKSHRQQQKLQQQNQQRSYEKYLLFLYQILPSIFSNIVELFQTTIEQSSCFPLSTCSTTIPMSSSLSSSSSSSPSSPTCLTSKSSPQQSSYSSLRLFLNILLEILIFLITSPIFSKQKVLFFSSLFQKSKTKAYQKNSKQYNFFTYFLIFFSCSISIISSTSHATSSTSSSNLSKDTPNEQHQPGISMNLHDSEILENCLHLLKLLLTKSKRITSYLLKNDWSILTFLFSLLHSLSSTILSSSLSITSLVKSQNMSSSVDNGTIDSISSTSPLPSLPMPLLSSLYGTSSFSFTCKNPSALLKNSCVTVTSTENQFPSGPVPDNNYFSSEVPLLLLDFHTKVTDIICIILTSNVHLPSKRSMCFLKTVEQPFQIYKIFQLFLTFQHNFLVYFKERKNSSFVTNVEEKSHKKPEKIAILTDKDLLSPKVMANQVLLLNYLTLFEQLFCCSSSFSSSTSSSAFSPSTPSASSASTSSSMSGAASPSLSSPSSPSSLPSSLPSPSSPILFLKKRKEKKKGKEIVFSSFCISFLNQRFLQDFFSLFSCLVKHCYSLLLSLPKDERRKKNENNSKKKQKRSFNNCGSSTSSKKQETTQNEKKEDIEIEREEFDNDVQGSIKEKELTSSLLLSTIRLCLKTMTAFQKIFIHLLRIVDSSFFHSSLAPQSFVFSSSSSSPSSSSTSSCSSSSFSTTMVSSSVASSFSSLSSFHSFFRLELFHLFSFLTPIYAHNNLGNVDENYKDELTELKDTTLQFLLFLWRLSYHSSGKYANESSFYIPVTFSSSSSACALSPCTSSLYSSSSCTSVPTSSPSSRSLASSAAVDILENVVENTDTTVTESSSSCNSSVATEPLFQFSNLPLQDQEPEMFYSSSKTYHALKFKHWQQIQQFYQVEHPQFHLQSNTTSFASSSSIPSSSASSSSTSSSPFLFRLIFSELFFLENSISSPPSADATNLMPILIFDKSNQKNRNENEINIVDGNEEGIETSEDNKYLRFVSNFESGNLSKVIYLPSSMTLSSTLLSSPSPAASPSSFCPNLLSCDNICDYDYQHYDLFLSPDSNTTRHQQWFFFGVQLPKQERQNQKQKYRFSIQNIDKNSSLFQQGMLPVWTSSPAPTSISSWFDFFQQQHWKRCSFISNICFYSGVHLRKPYMSSASLPPSSLFDSASFYSALTFDFEFPSNETCIYFAYCFPFSYSFLKYSLYSLTFPYLLSSNSSNVDEIKHEHLHEDQQNDDETKIFQSYSPYLHRQPFVETPLHNLIELLTITNWTHSLSRTSLCHDHPLFFIPLEERPIIFITSRIHPGECNSNWILQGILETLLTDSRSSDCWISILRSLCIFKIIPMLNPDGVVVGNTRTNYNGHDLNRCWKDHDAVKQLQLKECKQLVEKWTAITSITPSALATHRNNTSSHDAVSVATPVDAVSAIVGDSIENDSNEKVATQEKTIEGTDVITKPKQHKLLLYLDLHSHSRMKGVCLYGCKDKQQQPPPLLDQQSQLRKGKSSPSSFFSNASSLLAEFPELLHFLSHCPDPTFIQFFQRFSASSLFFAPHSPSASSPSSSVRLFHSILQNKIPTLFNSSSCSYLNSTKKSGTSRMVFYHQYGLKECYTLETSFSSAPNVTNSYLFHSKSSSNKNEKPQTNTEDFDDSDNNHDENTASKQNNESQFTCDDWKNIGRELAKSFFIMCLFARMKKLLGMRKLQNKMKDIEKKQAINNERIGASASASQSPSLSQSPNQSFRCYPDTATNGASASTSCRSSQLDKHNSSNSFQGSTSKEVVSPVVAVSLSNNIDRLFDKKTSMRRCSLPIAPVVRVSNEMSPAAAKTVATKLKQGTVKLLPCKMKRLSFKQKNSTPKLRASANTINLRSPEKPPQSTNLCSAEEKEALLDSIPEAMRHFANQYRTSYSNFHLPVVPTAQLPCFSSSINHTASHWSVSKFAGSSGASSVCLTPSRPTPPSTSTKSRRFALSSLCVSEQSSPRLPEINRNTILTSSLDVAVSAYDSLLPTEQTVIAPKIYKCVDQILHSTKSNPPKSSLSMPRDQAFRDTLSADCVSSPGNIDNDGW